MDKFKFQQIHYNCLSHKFWVLTITFILSLSSYCGSAQQITVSEIVDKNRKAIGVDDLTLDTISNLIISGYEKLSAKYNQPVFAFKTTPFLYILQIDERARLIDARYSVLVDPFSAKVWSSKSSAPIICSEDNHSENFSYYRGYLKPSVFKFANFYNPNELVNSEAEIFEETIQPIWVLNEVIAKRLRDEFDVNLSSMNQSHHCYKVIVKKAIKKIGDNSEEIIETYYFDKQTFHLVRKNTSKFYYNDNEFHDENKTSTDYGMFIETGLGITIPFVTIFAPDCATCFDEKDSSVVGGKSYTRTKGKTADEYARLTTFHIYKYFKIDSELPKGAFEDKAFY